MRPCPRCLDESLEELRTHSHCINCLYSPQLEESEAPKLPQVSVREFLKRLEACQLFEPMHLLFDNPEKCSI